MDTLGSSVFVPIEALSRILTLLCRLLSEFNRSKPLDFSETYLFPLDRTRRFSADVIDDPVDPLDLIDDPPGDLSEKI